jgi:hypothetical protein
MDLEMTGLYIASAGRIAVNTDVSLAGSYVET